MWIFEYLSWKAWFTRSHRGNSTNLLWTHHNTHGSQLLVDSFNFITAWTHPHKRKKWVLPLQKKNKLKSFHLFLHELFPPKTPSDLTPDTIQPMHHQPTPTQTVETYHINRHQETRSDDPKESLARSRRRKSSNFCLEGPVVRTVIGQTSLDDGTSDPQVMRFFKSICEVVKTTSQTLCRLVGIVWTYAYLYIISRCYREPFMIILPSYQRCFLCGPHHWSSWTP